MDDPLEYSSAMASSLGGLLAEGIFALGRVSLNSLDEWGAKIKAEREADEKAWDVYRENQAQAAAREQERLRDAQAQAQTTREAELWHTIAGLKAKLARKEEENKTNERLYYKVMEESNQARKELDSLKKENADLLLSGMAFASMAMSYAEKAGVIQSGGKEDDILKIFVEWTKKRFQIGEWSSQTVDPLLKAYSEPIEKLFHRIRNTSSVEGKGDIAYVIDSERKRVKIPDAFLWIFTKNILSLLSEFQRSTKDFLQDGTSVLSGVSFLKGNGKSLPKSNFRGRDFHGYQDKDLNESVSKLMRDRVDKNREAIKTGLQPFLEEKRRRVISEKVSSSAS